MGRGGRGIGKKRRIGRMGKEEERRGKNRGRDRREGIEEKEEKGRTEEEKSIV